MTSFFTFLLTLLLFVCSSASSKPLIAELDYKSQRQLFLEAEQLLRKHKRQQFQQHLTQLEHYPLLPYLIYSDYKKRLSYISPEQIDTFNNRFSNTPIAKRLNNQWLTHLAKNRRWTMFRENYAGDGGAKLECYNLRALYHSGEKEFALSKVKPLWLVGKSQPKACDSLFQTWQKSNHFNSDIAWQRFQLAMENNKYRLARYLIRVIDGKQKKLAEQWYQLRSQPERVGRLKLTEQPLELTQKIIRFAIKRLARYDADQAWKQWKTLSIQQDFSNDEIRSIERNLALASLLQKKALDNPELAQIIRDPRNSDLQEQRIRAALSVGDWQATETWLQRLSPQKQMKPEWKYWSIRTAEILESEQRAVTESRYAELALQRHYYGFLAADKIDANYQLEQKNINSDSTQVTSLYAIPSFIRARELFLLNRPVDARREWNQATRQMNTHQLAQAAKLADEWGWHDRAIHTVAKTPFRDDLELRFPLPHQQHVVNEAAQRKIDPAWVMAVIRQESAFMADARSNRGALGLMQIMPRTGQEIGRLIKSPLHNTANLLQSNLNIKFGAAYLKRNLKRLQNNVVPATAAYNAGYGNVRKWLPKKESIEADRWVETIRFSETRNYVQNIMAYSVIYDQRLNRPTIRLSERMPPINPRK